MTNDEPIEFVEIQVGSVVRKPVPNRTKASSRPLGHCWECNKPIGRTAPVCPHCGAVQAKKPQPFSIYVAAAIVAVAAVFVVYLMMKPTFEKLDRAEAELDKAIDEINAIQNKMPKQKR